MRALFLIVTFAFTQLMLNDVQLGLVYQYIDIAVDEAEQPDIKKSRAICTTNAEAEQLTLGTYMSV
ncbi:hypothetical protein FRC12_003274 [Ceratobasidium sp. 428]|nr:hypothetical protein FRC12_003274 [Ceratobasidium sp. 428]